MYNPIIEQLKILWIQAKRVLMYICFWHPVNHGMYIDLYVNQDAPKSMKQGFINELKYLKEHNASLIVYVDYWAGYFRQLSLLAGLVLIVLVRYKI